MIACHNCRPGVGFSLDDLYAVVANYAGQGSNTAGDISRLLLNAGVSVEAARQMLQTIASNVGSDQQQLLTVQQELAYLNNGYVQRSNNDWIFPVGVGVILFLLLRDKR